MSIDEEIAKRDAEFFKAYAKDRTLCRAKYYADHPIKIVPELKGFRDMPRNFNMTAPSSDHKDIYTFLAEYCTKFPNVKIPNIVLSGDTGTGKTFATKVMANILVDRKIDVHYTTAFAMVSAFQKYVQGFGQDIAIIEPFLDCGLLIIDDLGSEPTIKNVTQEHILNYS
jgi:DNA replication protein DnaC